VVTNVTAFNTGALITLVKSFIVQTQGMIAKPLHIPFCVFWRKKNSMKFKEKEGEFVY
jgi:hypothetical protein